MRLLPYNHDFAVGETIFVRDRLNPGGLIEGKIDMITIVTDEVRMESEGVILWVNNDRYTVEYIE